MCTYSMVMDKWDPIFPPLPVIPYVPAPLPWIPAPVPFDPMGPTIPPVVPESEPFVPLPPPNMTWAELIEKFKKEAEAARAEDIASGAPDCTDPEKAKLVERVAELERRLEQLERERASHGR